MVCVASVAEGEFIGDYQVLGVLGCGLTGTTYHVMSPVLNKEFALKTLGLTQDLSPEWIQRLEAQAVLLEKLVHPHIDALVSSGRYKDMFLCVKDFCHDGDGCSCHLGDFRRRFGGTLSHYQAVHVAEQMASALSFAHHYTDGHHHGVCHGNLKPENILMAFSASGDGGASFEVRVGDFQPYGLITHGLLLSGHDRLDLFLQGYPAHIREDALATDLETLYHPYDYQAPESVQKPTKQGDIFACGVIFYEMLTGHLPSAGFPPPSTLKADVLPTWDTIVMKCLCRHPEGRYASGEALYKALQEAFSDILKVEIPAPSPTRQERHSLTPRGMVYIPAGTFLVGSAECGSDALPQHEATTPGFYMDRTLVTNLQFSRFVLETSYVTDAEKAGSAPLWTDGEWKQMPGISWRNPLGRKLPDDFDLHPVTQVTHQDAAAYAEWLGRRLPTEEEWEYAARGGQREARFPWGDHISTAHAHCNADGPCAVMRFHANGYGLYDIVGNVWEWTSSWYKAYPGSAGDSPHFGEQYRVVRGGCWMYDLSHCLVSFRNATRPQDCYPTVGFRTVV